MSRTQKSNYFTPLTAADFPDRVGANRVYWFVKLAKKLNAYASVLRSFDSNYWRAQNASTQSFANNTWATYSMTSMVLDPQSIGITSGGYKIPEDGVYGAFGHITWMSVFNNNGRRGTRTKLDGAVIPGSMRMTWSTGNTIAPCSLVPFAALSGQIVTLEGYQDSGGSLTADRARLGVVRLG